MDEPEGKPRKSNKELNSRGGELAVLYQEAVKAKKPRTEVEPIANELLGIVSDLALGLLDKEVRNSRKTQSGVPSNLDHRDILQELMISVLCVLDVGGYKHEGHFRAWIFTLAINLFLDSLNYKKPKKGLTQKQKDEKEADELDDDSDEAEAWKSQPERGASTAKHIFVPLESVRENEDGQDEIVGYEPEGRGGYRGDPERNLVYRDLLNVILDGLRSVTLREGIEVWTARAFLGKNEVGILDLYELDSNTGTSHFRRASIDILAFINRHEDYKDLSLKGLREIVLAHPMLEERDLVLIADERQREALRLGFLPDMTVARLGEAMGLSKMAARKLLRAALVSLSQAKVRRALVVAPVAQGPEFDSWLWTEVGRMLDAYPEPLTQVRGEPSAADGELAALCQVAVMLVYCRDGLEPPKGFDELVGPRVQKDGIDATAKALGLERPTLMRILAGGVDPEQLGSNVVAKLASYFGMEPIKVVSSMRAGAGAVPGGRTRGLTPKELDQYAERVRRSILSRIGKP